MKSENGRSMVEMLGVLAIIGVLSVGAIAGYSKAMMKYKLNKHAEAINLLINNVLQLIPTLPLEKNGQIEYYAEIFKKLGLLPDGIKYLNSSSVEDNYFHVHTQIYAVYNPFRYGGIAFYFKKQTNSVSNICRNIVFAAKENADNLWMLETEYRNSINHNYKGLIYGNKYCNNTTYKCISKMTLKDTEQLCSDCADDQCTLFVFWRE